MISRYASKKWIRDPTHGYRMSRVDERVEPALEAMADQHGIGALEGGDHEVGDVAQAGDVVLVGALRGELRREFDHEQAAGQDVFEQVQALPEIRCRLQKGREQLERPTLSKIGDRHALSVPHRDEARLLELAHGLPQRVAIGAVLSGELALTRQPLPRA